MKTIALIAVAAVVTLQACSSAPLRDPAYAGVRPYPAAPTQSNVGAIYQPGQSLMLYENIRARQVGDTLTVRLAESTNASKKAATKTKKDTDVDIDNPTLFGSPVVFNARGLPLQRRRDNTAEVTINASQEFNGEGSSTQSNTLTGNITVTVVEVLANGNLVVRGEKILSLNQGDEHLRVAGVVRAADIQPDNSVISTQLADVTIQYGGSGVTDDANRMGWVTRFFNSKWWPF